MAGGGSFSSIIMTLATVYILIKFVMPMALDLAKEIPAHLPDLPAPATAQPEATPTPAPEATETAPTETTPAESGDSGGGGGGEESGGGGGDSSGGDSGGGGGGEDSGGGGEDDKESNYGTILESYYIPVNWT